MLHMIEEIKFDGKFYALVLSAGFNESGCHFFTPDNLSQQLAYMNHPKGKIIVPHIHNPVPREVHYTQEVLVIKQGKLRVDFYDDKQSYLESRILTTGDTILLAEGGHGFEVLEDLVMLEIKQGPYAGDRDKTRFEGISSEQADVKGS